jgi:hypothetical protein
MALKFEKFKIELRQTLLAALNEVLGRIGARIGFSAEIQIHGLPSIQDVDIAIEKLRSGTMPFTEVMDPFRNR